MIHSTPFPLLVPNVTLLILTLLCQSALVTGVHELTVYSQCWTEGQQQQVEA